MATKTEVTYGNMTFETFANVESNHKREKFSYDIFDVYIDYYGGMFGIELIGGWNFDEQVPEYGFGTGFGDDIYQPGFDVALRVALDNIRIRCYDRKIKDAAESALARACVEFHLKHRGML